MTRPVPATCEFITGIPYEGEHGGGQHLLFCESPPRHAFSLNGLSPLYVCPRHLSISRMTFAYYARDIVVRSA